MAIKTAYMVLGNHLFHGEKRVLQVFRSEERAKRFLADNQKVWDWFIDGMISMANNTTIEAFCEESRGLEIAPFSVHLALKDFMMNKAKKDKTGNDFWFESKIVNLLSFVPDSHSKTGFAYMMFKAIKAGEHRESFYIQESLLDDEK